MEFSDEEDEEKGEHLIAKHFLSYFQFIVETVIVLESGLHFSVESFSRGRTNCTSMHLGQNVSFFSFVFLIVLIFQKIMKQLFGFNQNCN